MRRQTIILGAGGLLVLTAALLLGGPARADGDARAGSRAGGVWTYDVRIVRVKPVAAEGAEAALPFGGEAGTTTDLPWKDALALLKQRGATTILLDQRVTTRPGEKATASSERTWAGLAINTKNKDDEQWRSMQVRTGCKLDVIPDEDTLRYVVQARWTAGSTPGADWPPEQFMAEWNGSHAHLDGHTLILHHGEQVPVGDGGHNRAVEIYVLLTGRLLQKR